MRYMKKAISTLLCLCLILALLPTAAVAESSYAIQLGYDGIKSGNVVYFGEYQNTYQVPWVVIEDVIPAPSDGTTNYISLLSKYCIGSTAYRTDAGYYAWDANGNASDSLLKAKMDGMYNKEGETLFTALEQSCVAATDVEIVVNSDAVSTQDYKKQTLTGARLFPLSQAEGHKLDNDLKKAAWISDTSTYSLYYLRDSRNSTAYRCTDPNGWPDTSSTDFKGKTQTRPAFNLDLSKVLFISDASNGKTNQDGTLAAVSSSSSSTYKLTLYDSSRSSFSALADDGLNQVEGYSSWNVTITYSGVKTGTNEYISAMLVNSSGEVIYYGRLKNLANSSDAVGTLDIAMPTGLVGEYTLKVFNEQYNKDNKTDYSSAFVDIPLNIYGSGMTLEQSVFEIYTSKIVLGGKEWWVVGNSTKGVYSKDNHLTLYGANADFGSSYFRASGSAEDGKSQEYGGGYYAKNPDGLAAWEKPSEYAGSNLEQSMVSLTGSLFSTQEQEAITARSFSAKETGQAISDKLWAMSTGEINTIFKDLETSSKKTILGSGYGYDYYMRNAQSDQKVYKATYLNASYITNHWDRTACYVNTAVGSGNVRPALSLNLNNVLFSCAAVGSKTGNGALIKQTENASSVRKLTLYDSARSGFSASASGATQPVGYSSWNVTITYSGAKTGTNEYLSAMLVDNSGHIMYYGRLKNLTEESNSSGEISVAIPTGLAGASYTLKVFNEQYNGDNKTDYSSAFVDINLTVSVPEYALSVVLGGGNGSTTGGNYAQGKGVSIDAGTRTGYVFAGWSSSNGGVFADSSKAATTFVMPGAATTITASWNECDHEGNTNSPTCTEGTTCSICGATIAKLGHEWSTDVTYDWTGLTTCTAKRVCQRNSEHSETATAAITSDVTTPATCENDGVRTYTATFSENWAKNQEKTETIEKLGHSLKWASGNGQYWQECERNGCSYRTEGKVMPQITITGADKVCKGQGYAFTFTLGEGLSNLSATYGFSTSANITNITKDEGNYKTTLSAADISAMNTLNEKTLTITICAETEDGYTVKEIKEVEFVVGHSYNEATCKGPKICQICENEEGEIDPANHTNLQHFAAKAATSKSDGNIEYWYCDGCGKYYSSQKAVDECEIEKEDTVIPKSAYGPETGDSTHIVLWLHAFILSAGLLTMVVINRKKKFNR